MRQADQKNFAENVTAIVVTYQPNLETLKSTLSALIGQVGFIFLIDNNSDSLTIDIIHQLINDFGYSKFQASFESDNIGLGAAYNKGIEFAKTVNAQYILLLDQDSEIESDLVLKLRTAHEKLTRRGEKIGAVGPRFTDPAGGHTSQFIQLGLFRLVQIPCTKDNHIAADFIVSSGSLIALETIEEIGNMDASLFIDHIDTEWCIRAKSKGFHIYGVCDALMQHSLGERRTQIWFIRWRTIPLHSSFRYYYIFRNSILLYRRQYMSLKWKLADITRLFIFAVFYGLCAKSREENLRMILKGCCDGLRGVTGKLKP